MDYICVILISFILSKFYTNYVTEQMLKDITKMHEKTQKSLIDKVERLKK